MALSTERLYVNWIRRFILFHNKRHPLEMGKTEVSAFLTHLAVDGNVSSSTQNQALCALLFLYREVLEQEFGWLDDVVRAKALGRVPVVLTHEKHRSIHTSCRATAGRCKVRRMKCERVVMDAGRRTPNITVAQRGIFPARVPFAEDYSKDRTK
jgi:hypothetical protein